MTIDNKIKDEKLQYSVTREAAKISASSSGRINKHEYLKAKKYYLLVQVKWYIKLSLLILVLGEFEKQTKTIEDQGKNERN